MGAQYQLFNIRDFDNVGLGHCDWTFNYRHNRAFGVVAKYELLYPAFHDPTKHKLHFHKLTLDELEFYQLFVNVEGVVHSLLDTHIEPPSKHDRIIGLVNVKQLAVNDKLILNQLVVAHANSNTASHSCNL